MRPIFRFLALILSANIASAAPAVTLIIDPNSFVLNGATDVELNGSLYDVEFVDGTCIDLFSGCDSNSDFDFQSPNEAAQALQAVLDQVLFGFVPQVNGCEIAECIVLLPFDIQAFQVVQGVSEQGLGLNVTFNQWFPGVDTSGADTLHTWVRFTPSEAAAVPEPGTWAMILLGFSAVGFVLRQSKKRVLATA